MQRCEVCCDVHEFQNFLMYVKESELTVIGRAKFAPNKKNEKKRKVKKFVFWKQNVGQKVLVVQVQRNLRFFLSVHLFAEAICKLAKVAIGPIRKKTEGWCCQYQRRSFSLIQAAA